MTVFADQTEISRRRPTTRDRQAEPEIDGKEVATTTGSSISYSWNTRKGVQGGAHGDGARGMRQATPPASRSRLQISLTAASLCRLQAPFGALFLSGNCLHPEPGVLFLMGAGLLGLGMARRRKSA
jgi:hypothetical protein